MTTNRARRTAAPPSVADEFADQLETLTPGERRSLVQYLSDAFYLNDCPPTRADVAALLEALPGVSGRRRLKPSSRAPTP